VNYEQSNYFNWLGMLFSDWCDCRNKLWPTTKIMINNSEIPRLAYSDSGDAELGHYSCRSHSALMRAAFRIVFNAREATLQGNQNVLGQTHAAIPQMTIQLQQLQKALCVPLGVPPQPFGPSFARLRGQIPLPHSTVALGIPADLLRRRPDVRAAELVALAKSARIGVAEAQLYPAISISGTFGGAASTANGHNLGEVFTSKGMTYAGGPAFQWNILN
jgi:hypothetical protein